MGIVDGQKLRIFYKTSLLREVGFVCDGATSLGGTESIEVVAG
jgi:hypothetical protein